jgi:hypothetical protein
MTLFVPPSLRRFVPRFAIPHAALGAAALEYDLVEALRPALVVDLGAGDASSFFACCQSIHEHDIDGIAYGIDLWYPGQHEDQTPEFRAMAKEGRTNYPGICYLVNMVPGEAVVHFPQSGIDLLRVDGRRAEVSGPLDIEAWYARLRPGAVVVWHGAADGSASWRALAARCRALRWSEGAGLGLALKPGAEPRGELPRLLFAEEESTGLQQLYRHVQRHLYLQQAYPMSLI